MLAAFLERNRRVPHRPAIRALLHDALPEIARRAARDRLVEIVEAAAARHDAAEPVVALSAVLVDLGQRRDQTLKQVEADAQVLRASVSTGNPRHALEELVGRLARPGRRAGDLAALDRALDPSALEDRLLRIRHEVDQTWELLATALACQTLTGVPASRRDELRRAAMDVSTDRTTRWTVRVAALRLLGALSDPERLPGETVKASHEALRRASRDRTDDPWVQVAAVEAWLPRCTAAEASGLLRWLVLPDASEVRHPDHLFARARFVGLAARHGAVSAVRDLLATDEPSEHVRMAAARALGGSDDPEDQALALALLATKDWRVATAGALATLDADGGMDAARWTRVGEALASAGNLEAARVLLDAAWARVREGRLPVELAPQVAPAWGPVTTRWSGEGVTDADVARSADVLAAWLRLARDEAAAAAWSELAAWVRQTPEGQSADFSSGPVSRLSGEALLEVLYTLSHEDVDLSAEPLGAARGLPDPRAVPARGWRIFVGLEDRRAAWRIAHEVRHPRHDKRQAHRHTIDQVPPGRFVAWSGRMAEVVATEVPGRRESTPTTLAWHEHLPLVANLLTGLRRGGVMVRAPGQRVRLVPQGKGVWSRTHRRYVQLTGLRGRLAAMPADEGVVTWDAALRETGFEVGRERLPATLATLPFGLEQWLGAAGASDVHTFGQLSALSMGALGVWTVTKVRRERQLQAWRATVPFVVGGWGSRGKSSVERLKSAMFHGLGYSVLCKSTGCEAMILFALPGTEAAEVFLYRPRDKATIVEQQTVLRIASRWKPQVVLWECMALNPLYTGILQREWMRDDMTTITNTYPDHEDIQGPAGRDVADVISEFTPVGGHLVTSEHHMTPVLERRARKEGSTFAACRPADWALIPRDLIKRFPYSAYDRNLSLVARLGERLGIPRDVSLRAMADHVLTDLGAFKRYGPVGVEGRSLLFINGCSANDRASFLSNWDRAELSTFGDDAGLSRWLFTILNNRADRLARQAMFARIAALDVAADRIVIIGTNVLPMRDGILESFEVDLKPALRQIAGGAGGRAKLFDTFVRRLRRRPHTAERADAIVAEARASRQLGPEPLPADDPWAAAEAAWREEVVWLGELVGDSWDVEGAIDRFVRFLVRRVTPLPDSTMSGDAILQDLAGRVPRGTRTELLGCENIKGTGLDFVYRWVSIERVLGWLSTLEQGGAADVRDVLERLTAYDGWGLYDARHAAGRLRAMQGEGVFTRLALDEDAEGARARIEQVIRAREAKLAHTEGSGEVGPIRALLRQADIVGSMRRRAAADRLYEDLAMERVGLARAAREADKLVSGEKK